MSHAMIHLSAEDVRARLSPRAAVNALRTALKEGFDPAQDIPRTTAQLTSGQMLLMPSQLEDSVGLKVLTLAPGNPDRDLPLIQGMYLLFDAQALTPTHLIDGEAVTNLRTPAVSVAAVFDALCATSEPVRAVCFGAGQQGINHVRTLRDTLAGRRDIESVTAIVRDVERAQANPSVMACVDHVKAQASSSALQALREANVIMCATTSPTPLFTDADVRDDAIVMAVGSHTPDARELPGELLARADVIVEDIATAERECGDVVMALQEGHLTTSDLIAVADYVRGQHLPRGARPLVFKSSGMSWEDLVIAQALVREDPSSTQ